ncbi:MAG: lysoplasmalogenase [Christensenella sp.]|nr:lysoplasmalogenase [Christensenella sp.]
MNAIFAALYLLDIGIHLFACASRDRLMLRRVSKCFLMPLLAICYCLFADSIAPLVLAAILFGFAGDVILLFRPRRFAFPAGMMAFATGHALYIAGFWGRLTLVPKWFFLVLLCSITLAAACTLLHYLWKRLPKKLRVPSFLYMLVIGSMASSATLFAFYGATSLRWLALVGGVLFALSDATLSIDAFHHPVRYRNVIVMSTYILAQSLIVSSLTFS